MKRSLITLSNSVNNLCNSALSHSELVQRHQYLKLTLEKLELRFLLTRTHLREAWRYPPLLFATGEIQPFEWNRLWETTLQDDLVVNPREVEEQISHALDTIGVDPTRLYDLYEDITASDQQQQTHFRHDVLKSLREIAAGLPKENTFEDNLHAGEGDQDAQAREREMIQRNANFMEPLAGLNENEEPLIVVDE
ncbi:hypothetical protein GCK32_011962 [Trichostrongylus colubriformis]|uniref:Uncharacterized protein n=1 Tax=Trichostrongylus colubriformis TaxID=6319 RepID=A0AAN8FTE0_TRICO